MLAVRSHIVASTLRLLLFAREQPQGTAHQRTARLATATAEALHAPQQISIQANGYLGSGGHSMN
jgi:hypothetical protein